MISLFDDRLDDWRQRIRKEILAKRRSAAIEGNPDAPLEAFIGNKLELAREVEHGLETMIRNLELQKEADEEFFLECGDSGFGEDSCTTDDVAELEGDEDDLSPDEIPY